MPEVAIDIPIRVGYHGKSYLMETIFNMDFLPQVGDVFHPLKFDSEAGLTFEVSSRYWDESGKAVLLVGQHIVDPPEAAGPLPRGWHAWWTDRDGDLVDTLRTNGWWEYGEPPIVVPPKFRNVWCNGSAVDGPMPREDCPIGYRPHSSHAYDIPDA